MRWEMLRPKPVPFPISFVVKNGRKIFSANAGEIGGPLLLTVIKTKPGSDLLSIRIHFSVSGAIASFALFNKFKITWEIWLPRHQAYSFSGDGSKCSSTPLR